MNKFLKQLDITFRRDPENYRPRINKLDSQVSRIKTNQSQIYTCIYVSVCIYNIMSSFPLRNPKP